MSDQNVALNCTSVSEPYCPVEDTIYGYRPNLGVNSFFVAIFALLAIANLGAGIRWKTWFFGGVMVCGCLGESIGYAGRVMMYSNPYWDIAFSMQISCLIFSPAFFAAAIYLNLKHIVLNFGESTSRIPAYLYTWIFVSCDVLSLLLQAVGGGMAASANGDSKTLDLGTDLMMAGIVIQVITLIAFATLVIDYVVRTRRHWADVGEQGKALSADKRFKRFAWALTVAFTGVFLRSVYRIAEMAGGWASPIMRDQISFIIMEGVLILISVLAITIFHPGYSFPQINGKPKVSKAASIESGEKTVTTAA